MPAGIPLNCKGGEMDSPAQVYFAEMASPSTHSPVIPKTPLGGASTVEAMVVGTAIV